MTTKNIIVMLATMLSWLTLSISATTESDNTSRLIAYAMNGPCDDITEDESCPYNVGLLDVKTGEIQVIETGLVILSSIDASPINQQLIYQNSGDDDGFYVVNYDGTDRRFIDLNLVVSTPIWSPDGRKIALMSSAEELIVVNLDGSDVTQIPMPAWILSIPKWSPDSQYLAVLTIEPATNLVMDYVVRVDGSQLTRLTDGPLDDAPYWSPNSEGVAFRVQSDTVFFNILTGDRSIILESERIEGWVLDDHHIIYATYSPDHERGEILKLFNLNDQTTTDLNTSPVAGFASIDVSPDRQALLYTAYDEVASTCIYDLTDHSEICYAPEEINMYGYSSAIWAS